MKVFEWNQGQSLRVVCQGYILSVYLFKTNINFLRLLNSLRSRRVFIGGLSRTTLPGRSSQPRDKMVRGSRRRVGRSATREQTS
jgi:hypothetical protein